LERPGDFTLVTAVRDFISCRWLGLFALICLVGVGRAVEKGMARVNVLQELGRPVSAIAKGNTEILTYKDGVRITLKDGHVTGIAGLKQEAEAPEPTDAAAPMAKDGAKPAPAAAAEPKAPVLTKEQLAEQAR
jgi:hypothetical protein